MATYDIEALKADLPTAKDLAQFVYDRTQISLDLIGKSKEDQYIVAKNALEGKKIPAEYITDENLTLTNGKPSLLMKNVNCHPAIQICLLKKIV